MLRQPVNTYIGTGLTFPIILEEGKPVLSDINTSIEASIRNLIIWPFNARYFERSFGCRIHELIEEPQVDTVKFLSKEFIHRTISDWEKRIDSVVVTTDFEEDGSLTVTIKYRVKLTNTVQKTVKTLII